MDHLNHFFKQYADYGKNDKSQFGWRTCRVSDEFFTARLPLLASATKKLKNWQPSDLPEVISGLCDQYGIKFIDLTPVLIRATSHNKQLLYNSIYDTHLNSHGS